MGDDTKPSRKAAFHAGTGLFCLLALIVLPGVAASQETTKARANSVEAAFLRNFTRYVTWPAKVFGDGRSPWHICVLGEDPFGDVLENTFRGRTEQGRAFELFRADTLDALPQCQIVFIASRESAFRRAVLAELKKRPVLTVGDAPDFLQDGGVVRFRVTDYVEMSINLDQARAASLGVQTRMLEVSREVLENGVMHKVR